MEAGDPRALEAGVRAAAEQFRAAAAANKCRPCGCLHDAIDGVERAFPDQSVPAELAGALVAARARLEPVRYDCLGCAVCFPALAVNALNEAGVEVADTCPAEPVAAGAGWPPLPGEYRVLRFRAPVAVCTLTDAGLADHLVARAGPEVAIVGALQTENLGIERILQNVLANPSIRFLLLCGADSRQRIGHLPGQSLLALAAAGVDERGRIVGAPGRRPVLQNVARGAVESFRRQVEVIDRIGHDRVDDLLEVVRQCAERDPGPAEPSAAASAPAFRTITGYLPERMVPDPAGYFVVYADRRRRRLSLEHYGTEGRLDAIIEGASAAEVYVPAIDQALVTRLDHAAYLGRELARAEAALRADRPYLQDGAPEHPAPNPTPEPAPGAPPAPARCGPCGPSCGDQP